MSEWRPIETAPRDGTTLLMWSSDPDEGYMIAFWNQEWIDYTRFDHGDARTWRNAGEEIPAEYTVWAPTHWMPLPEPPEDA